MKNRIIKNIFSSWGVDFIMVVVRFFMTPLFVRKLGDSDYGIWILVLSLVGYMELLNLGINTASVRYLAKNLETKNYKAANEIFNSGLFMFMIISALILLIILSVSPFLKYSFPFMDNFVYIIVFIIAGLNLALDFSFYSFSAILSARQQYFEANIISAVIFFIRNIVAAILLLTGFTLLAIVINQTVFNIIKGIIISAYSLRSDRNFEVKFSHINKNTLKTIVNFSIYIFVINISKKITQYGSPLIIAFFMSPIAITFFAIANNLVSYLQNFISAIPNVLIPRFSQLDAGDNQERIREYYLSFTRITLIVAVPVVFLLIFYGKSFISLWIGKEYGQISGPILAVLSIGALCQIFQNTTHSVLKATGRHKKLSYFVVLESISILILSLFLIKSYGLIGLAFAQAIPMAFFNLTIVPIYACRELKIGFSNYYSKYLLNNVLCVLPLLVIYYFLESDVVNSIPVFGMIGITIVGIYLVFSYLLMLNEKERGVLRSLICLK